MLLPKTVSRSTFDFPLVVFAILHCNDIRIWIYILFACGIRFRRQIDVPEDQDPGFGIVLYLMCLEEGPYQYLDLVFQRVSHLVARMALSTGSVESFKSAGSSKITSTLSSGRFPLQKHRFTTELWSNSTTEKSNFSELWVFVLHYECFDGNNP